MARYFATTGHKDMDTDTPISRPLARHIQRTVRITFAGLVFERCVQAFLWFGVVVCLAISAVLLGVFSNLSGLMWNIVAGCLAVGFVATFGLGVARFHMPTLGEARGRVDGALPNSPLQALQDLNATGQVAAQIHPLWVAHQMRMAQQASKAHVIAPKIRLSEQDPFAIRLLALTALIMGLLFGSGGASTGAIPTSLGLESGLAWEGWIDPPQHTGKPTLYLADLSTSFTAPKNSKVTIRFYDTGDAVQMRQTVSEVALDSGALTQDFRLEKNGEIEIDGPMGRVWDVALLPDTAPVAELIGDMTRAASGELRQSFRVFDDFGVVRAQLKLELDRPAIVPRYGFSVLPEPRDAVTLSIPLPRSRERTDIVGVVAENLSRHPYSGLPVRVSLRAWDAAGNESVAAQSAAILPGRKFFDPLAAALIDVRRELLWSRKNAIRSAQIIRAVSYAQDGAHGGNHKLFLRLRSIAGGLEARGAQMSRDAWNEIAESIWDIAVELEDGDLSEALERLQRAQERLLQAMRDGATPEEIAKLMQDLRDATQAYIKKLAEQQDQSDQADAQSGETLEMSANQLQELMDRIQKLMEQGRMAEAQQLMDFLNELLQNIQVSPSQGQSGQAIEGLQDLSREQQQLNDETFTDLQEQFGGQGRELPEQGEGPDALADSQGALRDALRSQKQNLPADGSSGQADENLDEAEQSMAEAEDALREGDFASALEKQARAMEALREGMRQLAQSDDAGDADRGESQAQQSGPNGSDPLGRTADGPSVGNGDIPAEDEAYEQAQDLLDEIRRRSAQRERADKERDYLNRLLDRF
ncbi:DUF4175 domain-containing protein [Pacificibacter marinus]|uniref:TIGR02302 family protein n=1 Tax=Pacificibacter marinus TaxID=658057 RepID=A0A1Y5TK10_9RHOB|nr:DUF4175 family protein [Pacificibacter marinus]SEL18662.1 TIGR02302 family protein [Pacificibacter marinus]SLN63751.1 hypothetical protein PAM7971_03323 [Pacificibacter marinus]